MKKVSLLILLLACSIGMASAKFQPKPFEWDVEYRGEVNIGAGFGGTIKAIGIEVADVPAAPSFETVHGAMLSDYLFVGAGIGLNYYPVEVRGTVGELYDDELNAVAIPIFADVKGFFPINDKLKPFLNLGLGGSVVAHQTEDLGINGGFYCDFGAGVQYKDWNFGLGLQHQSFGLKYSDIKCSMNSFYVKVGLVF
jgi:hypothetical protein